MRHVLWMALFACLTAVVFGVVAKGTERQRLMYGLKVLAEFLAVAGQYVRRTAVAQR